MVRLTSVPEGETAIAITSLIPAFLRERWFKVVITPSPGTIRLGSNWSIEDLRELASSDVEAGGLLGPDAVLLETGNRTSVCSSSGPFTWHNHKEEPAMFSLQDWASFIISSSIWSLLITPLAFQVYVKIDGQLVNEARSELLGYSQDIPSAELMNRRLKKFVANKTTNPNPDETEQNIGKAVGISVEVAS
ncbi:MAG: hypothetical protein QF502_00790 [Nitrospinaceae bacterium]|nr:hypothetical protein [Nitrospinaceae bacterium]